MVDRIFERLLQICTIVTFILGAWVLSLWLEDDRVCFSHPRLAALHLEVEGDYNLVVPRCSPMSALFQPELSSNQVAKLDLASRVFEKTLMVADRLSLPVKAKFHLLVGEHQDPVEVSTGVMEAILKRADVNEERIKPLALFYSHYVYIQYFEKRVSWIDSKYQAAFLSGDIESLPGLRLVKVFQNLNGLTKVEMLKQAWKTSEAELMELASKDSKEETDRKLRQLLELKALVKIDLKDQLQEELLLAELSPRLSEQKGERVVVQTEVATVAFPDQLQVMVDSSEFSQREWVYVQCGGISAQDVERTIASEAYYLELCPDDSPEYVVEVAEKIAAYLESSTEQKRALRSRLISKEI